MLFKFHFKYCSVLFAFPSFPLPFRVSVQKYLHILTDPAYVLTLGTLLLDQSQMVGSTLIIYRHE